MTDDDRDRDDEILDEEDEEEDDEQIDRFQSRRPPVKPFATSGSGLGSSSSRPPTSGSSSPGSGRDSSQLPGSRPGGYQSRYGSSPASGSSSSGSSSSPFSSSGLARPGSSSPPSTSRPAFSPPGGVIGGRRDHDDDEAEDEGRPSTPAASSSASSPSRTGFGSFRSPASGSERPPERRDPPSSPSSSAAPPRSSSGFSSSAASSPSSGSSSPSSSSGGGPLGGFRSKLPGGKSDQKPAAPRSSSSSPAQKSGSSPLSGISQGLGGLRSKLPGGKGDQKPAAPRSSGSPAQKSGGGPLGGISQGLGGLRSKLPGGKGDQKPAPSGSTSSGSRSPFSSASSSGPSLGGRAPSSSPASTTGKRDTKAAAGGLFSRLPFVGKKEETRARPASTREKMERASKAPKIDERGLTLDNKLDILGVGLLLGSLALFFSSMSSTKGQLTEAVNTFLVQLLGVGAIAVPLVMFAIGIWLIIRHFGDEAPIVDPVRLIGIGLIYVGVLLLFQFMESFNPEYAGINLRNLDELRLQLELSYMLGRGGGWLGAELYYVLVANIGEAGMVVSMVGLLLIGIMLTVRISAAELAIFFISIWRSFVDSQRRRSQTREARARLRAAELAAAAESRVSITKPVTAELPGGSSPALPAAASVEPGEEPRPIPITMGGRTVTAFFEGKDTVPLETGAMTEAKPEADSPSIAARLFSAVPSLGRSSTDKAAQPAAEQKSGGRFGGLLNRGANAQPQPEAKPVAATPAQAPATPGILPAAATVAAGAAAAALGAATSQNRQPEATPTAPAGPAEAAPQDQPVRIGDLMRGTDRPSPFSRSGAPTAPANTVSPTSPAARPVMPVDDDDEDEEDEQLSRVSPAQPGSTASTPRPATGNLWSRPAANPSPTSGAPSLDERRERLNAIRSGQGARPLGETPPARQEGERPASAPPQPQRPAAAVAPAVPAPTTPQRQPITFGERPEHTNGNSTVPAPAEQRPQASPAFGRPAGPPAAPPPRKRREWKLPDYRAVLSTGSESDFDREVLLKSARTIEETLQSFGAPGRVVEVNTGPVITQFGVEPDYLVSRSGKKSRVKVGAIAQLDKDLQLALGAKSIRIEAPVPGKGYVGIEVPNEEASIVSLRDVMESEQFRKIRAKSPLALALGQSVDGTPIAADLGVMPHLLIAGTTGSGKSVLVNAIINCLLINNPPDIVKFVMVDPKRVELTGYNGIPHLVAPVVVDLERTVGVLKWVTREMDERYKQFSNASARNIEDFNKHLPSDREPMPYIVVIIDELADLMMLAPDETERVITRIAALARATGIHLVIATQRPSVDVVTGLIKANFPARVAFAVAGGVDSRVILDQPGAERLLGRGDMLYLSGNSPAPLRLQGVWVSEPEIANITRYWTRQNATQPEPHIIKSLAVDDEPEEARTVQPVTSNPFAAQAAFWDDEDDDDEGLELHERVTDDRDELYDQAVEMVRRLNKASVSLLQRRLRIGYTRAARLIDMMEAEGIVGPAQEGSKPREVLPPA